MATAMTSDWFLHLTSVWPSMSTARRIEQTEVDLDDGIVYLDHNYFGDKVGGDDDRSYWGWSNKSTKFDDDSPATNNSQVSLDRNGLWREHPLHSEERRKEVLLRRANARVRIIWTRPYQSFRCWLRMIVWFWGFRGDLLECLLL